MLTRLAAILSISVVFASGGLPASAHEAAAARDRNSHHVLLISVDGLHASDLTRWVMERPDSRLAGLSRIGTTFENASSAEPSDSFPGLLAMLTGGTPRTTGVFYDDTYTRDMWPAGTACKGPAGTETLYAENLDRTDASGNVPLFTSIDPSQLPLGMLTGTCAAILPHQFLRTNTIFNVARAAGMYTAWSDKHPAYEIVNGPSGEGVNDLFTPEINNVNDPTTQGVAQTAAYDQIKVQAILNEIHGKRSDGTGSAPVPAIFGMNFQAVSVGQKLVDPAKSCQRNPTSTCDPAYVPGGYAPGTLKFTPQLAQALSYVDGAIGSMVDALRGEGLLQSTELIVSAKHGQSPIDPAKLAKIGDQVTAVLTAAGIQVAQNTTDDLALVWLKDQHQSAAAVEALQTDKAGANTARVDFILSGPRLAERFGNPLGNSRTPDLIVQPIPGTIYTQSKAKVAEHGGFAEDDTHVALLVVGGSPRGDRADDDAHDRRVSTPVRTTQIAPTILAFLDLDPDALQSVRAERTRALPLQIGS